MLLYIQWVKRIAYREQLVDGDSSLDRHFGVSVIQTLFMKVKALKRIGWGSLVWICGCGWLRATDLSVWVSVWVIVIEWVGHWVRVIEWVNQSVNQNQNVVFLIFWLFKYHQHFEIDFLFLDDLKKKSERNFDFGPFFSIFGGGQGGNFTHWPVASKPH